MRRDGLPVEDFAGGRQFEAMTLALKQRHAQAIPDLPRDGRRRDIELRAHWPRFESLQGEGCVVGFRCVAAARADRLERADCRRWPKAEMRQLET